MGGEGGGVLTSWIVGAARQAELPVQATSIPGVAQRTGATTYYIEIWPQVLAPGEAWPVFSLAPAQGEVDFLVATELLETGRMVESGFVTPDRTTLLASTHRVFTTGEKMAMGDGRADAGVILAGAKARAKSATLFDMKSAALASGAVINAVVLGGIAESGVLPLSADQLEAAIRAEGKAVEANLRGYQAGIDAVRRGQAAESESAASASGAKAGALGRRVSDEFPAAAAELITIAVARLIDFQDQAYAAMYLDRLREFAAADPDLLLSVVRHLGVRMSFEDVYRVAQAKSRPGRLTRIRGETGADDNDIVMVTEYFKPRFSEICDSLPRGLAAWLLGLARMYPSLAKKSWPMEIRTTTFSGFLRLKFLASMKRFRRSSLRYHREQRDIDLWLGLVGQAAKFDAGFALEVAECARLIKGYGDTHARGSANFAKIVETVITPVLSAAAAGTGGLNAAASLAAAREAALADPEGQALDEALAADCGLQLAG
jgi:indolepyruvate ferredoxin oxidoreductase beta subunit